MSGENSSQLRDNLPEGGDAVSVWTVAAAIMKHLPLVSISAVIVSVALTLPLLLGSRTYSSTASFVSAQRRSSAPSFSGLAAQLGVSVPSGDGAQSPAFYADLAQASSILRKVVHKDYVFDADTGRFKGTLVEYWGGTDTPAEKEELAIRRLRSTVKSSVAQKTGIVSITAKTRSAGLSQNIAANLLEEIHAFNLESRQSQAAAERRFAERRLAEARSQLRAAEDRLQSFLQQNRDYRGAPDLLLEHDRRLRDVAMQQQVYTSLAQAFEQAQIDEVRDTPVISVVELPRVPVYPDGRGLIRRAIFGIVSGLLVGIVIAVLLEVLNRLRTSQSRDYLQLREAASRFSRILPRRVGRKNA